jgi:hypothetical protein
MCFYNRFFQGHPAAGAAIQAVLDGYYQNSLCRSKRGPDI